MQDIGAIHLPRLINYFMLADDLSEKQRHRGHDDIVTSVALSEVDADKFTSVGQDGAVNVWNFEYEKPFSSAYVCGNIAINSVANSFESPFLSITVSQDGFCRLWDSRELIKGCSQLVSLNQTGTAVTWSKTMTSQCVVGLADGNILSIDWRANGCVSRQPVHSARVNSIRPAYGDNASDVYVTSSDDHTSVVFKEMCAAPAGFDCATSDTFR